MKTLLITMGHKHGQTTDAETRCTPYISHFCMHVYTCGRLDSLSASYFDSSTCFEPLCMSVLKPWLNVTLLRMTRVTYRRFLCMHVRVCQRNGIYTQFQDVYV